MSCFLFECEEQKRRQREEWALTHMQQEKKVRHASDRRGRSKMGSVGVVDVFREGMCGDGDSF